MFNLKYFDKFKCRSLYLCGYIDIDIFFEFYLLFFWVNGSVVYCMVEVIFGIFIVFSDIFDCSELVL